MLSAFTDVAAYSSPTGLAEQGFLLHGCQVEQKNLSKSGITEDNLTQLGWN